MKSLHLTSDQTSLGTKPLTSIGLDWFDSPLGQLLTSKEVAKVEQLLPAKYYGICVQLGLPSNRNYFGDEREGLQLYLSNSLTNQNKLTKNKYLCLSRFSQLPLGKRTVDLVIMPHTLDLTYHPLQVLREVSQIIDNEGTLVLIGFNPISLFWGSKYLINLFSGKKSELFSHTPARVKEWLELLGFEVTAGCYMDYLPLINRPELRSQLSFLNKAGDRWWPVFGGVYIIIAQKKVWRPARISMLQSLTNRLNPKSTQPLSRKNV